MNNLSNGTCNSHLTGHHAANMAVTISGASSTGTTASGNLNDTHERTSTTGTNATPGSNSTSSGGGGGIKRRISSSGTSNNNPSSRRVARSNSIERLTPSPAPSNSSYTTATGDNGRMRQSSSSSNGKVNGSTSRSSDSCDSKNSNSGPNPYADNLKGRCNCKELAHVECHLENKDLWDKFNELGTEMIITKTGRYVFYSRSLGEVGDGSSLLFCCLENSFCSIFFLPLFSSRQAWQARKREGKKSERRDEASELKRERERETRRRKRETNTQYSSSYERWL